MTGFARVHAERESLAVPREAVLSISAGKGLVCMPEENGEKGWTTRLVRLGYVDEDWVEIAEGLAAGESVICEGHRNLEVGDRIRIEATERISSGATASIN